MAWDQGAHYDDDTDVRTATADARQAWVAARQAYLRYRALHHLPPGDASRNEASRAWFRAMGEVAGACERLKRALDRR